MLNEKVVDDNSTYRKTAFNAIKFRYLLLKIIIGFGIFYFLFKPLFIDRLGFNDFSFKYSVATATYVLAFLLCYRVLRKNNIPLKNLFILKDKKINWFEIISLYILMRLISVSFWGIFLLYCTYFDPSSLSTVASPPPPIEPIPELALLVFQAVCVAPIVEEVVFRGVLLQSWAVRWGLKRGIIFSSLVFALLHFSPEIMDKFIGGIFLSILFIKYRSLIISIIFHILNNSIAQLESLFRHDTTSTDLTLYQYKTTGWALLIIFLLTFTIFMIYLKKNNLHDRMPVS